MPGLRQADASQEKSGHCLALGGLGASGGVSPRSRQYGPVGLPPLASNISVWTPSLAGTHLPVLEVPRGSALLRYREPICRTPSHFMSGLSGQVSTCMMGPCAQRAQLIETLTEWQAAPPPRLMYKSPVWSSAQH